VTEARRGHAGLAVQLVDALVVADLPQEVGEGAVPAVLDGVAAWIGLSIQLGMLGHVGHVLVLGMVLEVGIEPVAGLGPDQQQQPGHVVVQESDQPRRQPVPDERLPEAGALREVLQDQQVPLLVVLFRAGRHDALEDPPG
jgi:hypothetical protein